MLEGHLTSCLASNSVQCCMPEDCHRHPGTLPWLHTLLISRDESLVSFWSRCAPSAFWASMGFAFINVSVTFYTHFRLHGQFYNLSMPWVKKMLLSFHFGLATSLLLLLSKDTPFPQRSWICRSLLQPHYDTSFPARRVPNNPAASQMCCHHTALTTLILLFQPFLVLLHFCRGADQNFTLH